MKKCNAKDPATGVRCSLIRGHARLGMGKDHECRVQGLKVKAWNDTDRAEVVIVVDVGRA